MTDAKLLRELAAFYKTRPTNSVNPNMAEMTARETAVLAAALDGAADELDRRASAAPVVGDGTTTCLFCGKPLGDNVVTDDNGDSACTECGNAEADAQEREALAALAEDAADYFVIPENVAGFKRIAQLLRTPPAVTEAMVEAAVKAWFDCGDRQADDAMRIALAAALQAAQGQREDKP